MKYTTNVCIIGAGPAGLLLSHLLSSKGINNIVFEKMGRNQILSRIRAGVLDQNTTDILINNGIVSKNKLDMARHSGFQLLIDGKFHRIDLSELTGGRAVTLYPQHEVVNDLLLAVEREGGTVNFDVSVTDIEDICSNKPIVNYYDGELKSVECEFVIGCDGYHGVCRKKIPKELRVEYAKVYPFSWLGILCVAPPSANELIYAPHPRGFALVSTRSATLQRMYLQCENGMKRFDWDDKKIWEEFDKRLVNTEGWSMKKGEIVQRDIVQMRSFACETMRFGNLFLAGDAAHIVPPSAAKGLNLAVSDVKLLFKALTIYYSIGSTEYLDQYSIDAMENFWKGEHFSFNVTNLLHRYPNGGQMEFKQQRAALKHLVSSKYAAAAFAENYVGIAYATERDQ